MNITSQQNIIALSETRSVTKAAERIGITQAAMTKWLDRIEWELGTKLAVRIRNDLTLTEAGRIYLEGAREMLDLRNKARRSIAVCSGQSTGAITITGTPTTGVTVFPELFQPFTTAFPETELKFIDSYNQQSLRLVLDGKADFAFCNLMERTHEGLEIGAAKAKELIILIPKGNPFYYDASKTKPSDVLPVLSLEELKGQTFILPTPEVSFYSTLKRLFALAGYEPDTLYRSANVRAIYKMACNGQAIGFSGRRNFNPEDPVAPYSFSPNIVYYNVIAYRRDEKLSAAGEFVVNWIKRRFAGS